MRLMQEERLTISAMAQLRDKFHLTASYIKAFGDDQLAVLDQFSTRFAKLQDAMGSL